MGVYEFLKDATLLDVFFSYLCSVKMRETAFHSWRNGLLLPEKRPIAPRQTGQRQKAPQSEPWTREPINIKH
jgi:hypothetical protein